MAWRGSFPALASLAHKKNATLPTIELPADD